MLENKLFLPKPISCGIFLTYRCCAICKHCIYASSPKWSFDFISLDKLELILQKLALWIEPKNYITFNAGIHFSGGEPFLNFTLLLEGIKVAKKYRISPVIIETNCFWAKDFNAAVEKLTKLKLAGLDGILLSINPFILEFINFTHIKTAKEASTYVFGEDKVILYQNMFYELIFSHHIDTKLKFENFLSIYGIQPVSFMELLPMGRAVYKLAFLYKKFQAEKFFSENCIFEFQNPYHIHIDNYGNYIPSFCAGLSLNNIFKTDDIFTVDLKEKPIIKALCQNIEELYYIGKQFDYQLNKEGYISKCHLCVDIRKHIALKTNNFKELSPTEYYYHLLE